ncbi:hypothetical protein [Lyngbya sp. CCY1209]|uniref:hypothetical protein n=1 Tax=Lyngbya sp. CCY1209 TaxID=2886103 RepID=UPI002D1FCAD7|nr:hypothetical protein [Lyngbya sp. CCY1209]MEB3886533.1 hypothetical protein [Lyngbya sp. CCY1209]
MSDNEQQASRSATWIDIIPAGRILVIGLVIACGIVTVILFFKGGSICIPPVCGLEPIAAAGVTVILLTTVFGMSALPALGVGVIVFAIVKISLGLG